MGGRLKIDFHLISWINGVRTGYGGLYTYSRHILCPLGRCSVSILVCFCFCSVCIGFALGKDTIGIGQLGSITLGQANSSVDFW